MPRHRGLHRHLRGLAIAHLADHHDVRILTEDGTQRACEGDAGLPLHRHLRDAGQVIFDGVLDRDHLLAQGVSMLEGGVERRRLSAPRRARDEEQAVRTPYESKEGTQERLRHSERREIGRRGPTIEQAEHYALAVDRGHRRDAEVELPLGEAEPDPSILRPAPLGDVELGDRLESGDDREVHLARRLRRGREDAVHAEPHVESRARGLEVDVARAGVDRLAEEQVDVADDRRLVREVADVCGAFVVGLVRRDPLERDDPIRLGRREFHEPLQFGVGDSLGTAGSAVDTRQLLQRVSGRLHADGDDERPGRIRRARTDAMAEQVGARDARGERDGGLDRGGHALR